MGPQTHPVYCRFTKKTEKPRAHTNLECLLHQVVHALLVLVAVLVAVVVVVALVVDDHAAAGPSRYVLAVSLNTHRFNFFLDFGARRGHFKF